MIKKADQKISGSEFVSQVSNVLGQGIRQTRWIAILFDECTTGGEIQTFESLAFEAKSFQKLSRLSEKGMSNVAGSEKIELEMRSTMKRIIRLLDSVSMRLGEEARIDFRRQFRDDASPGELLTLLDDFAKIKDFYLRMRDKEGISRRGD